MLLGDLSNFSDSRWLLFDVDMPLLRAPHRNVAAHVWGVISKGPYPTHIWGVSREKDWKQTGGQSCAYSRSLSASTSIAVVFLCTVVVRIGYVF